MNAATNSTAIVELRARLRAQFPAAHAEKPLPHPSVAGSTGHPCMDLIQLDHGCLTEVVGVQPCSGAGVLLAGVLDHTLSDQKPAALIDARNTFDPGCLRQRVRHRLLWLRCQCMDESLRAADLLLRDGNLPLIVLDLLGIPAREARSVPGSVWFRLRALSEQSGAALLALTPCKTIPCTQRRLETVQRFGIDAVDAPLDELFAALHPRLLLERARWHAAAASSDPAPQQTRAA